MKYFIKLKSLILYLSLTFISFNLSAQNGYKKGYFITKKNKKVQCYVLNEDLYHVPTKFYYKPSLNTKEQKSISTEDIQVLFIEPNIKYKRYSVKIDYSSSYSNKLSPTRLSNFQEKSLLLKILVEGKVSLLQYSISGLERFYTRKNDTIQPLEYKLYKTKNNKIGKNITYQKQLRESFKYTNKKTNIAYDSSDLASYFVGYNQYLKEKFIDYTSFSLGKKKGKFNLKGKLSIGLSNTQNSEYSNVGSTNEFKYKIGFEAEYILPFNNYKWAIFLEPTYNSNYNTVIKFRNGTAVTPSSGSTVTKYGSTAIDYNAIEFPLGIRYYPHLSEKSSFFINTGINFNISLNNKLLELNPKKEIKPSPNYFIGIGYILNYRYSLEVRYNMQRDLNYLNVKYNNISIKLGYNFL